VCRLFFRSPSQWNREDQQISQKIACATLPPMEKISGARSARRALVFLNMAMDMRKLPINVTIQNILKDCKYICGNFIFTAVCRARRVLSVMSKVKGMHQLSSASNPLRKGSDSQRPQIRYLQTRIWSFGGLKSAIFQPNIHRSFRGPHFTVSLVGFALPNVLPRERPPRLDSVEHSHVR
jgi:hypothetical protein